LSSKSYIDSDEKTDPHCKFDDLKLIHKDLILLSGNHRDLFGKLFKLNKLKQIEENIKALNDLFKNNFYLEIQRHNEPDEENFENYLIQLSEKYKIPLIATQEIYYLKQDMYEAHDALVCIGQKNFVDDGNRENLAINITSKKMMIYWSYSRIFQKHWRIILIFHTDLILNQKNLLLYFPQFKQIKT
jgi:DNA polymerase-3 subunit alpha